LKQVAIFNVGMVAPRTHKPIMVKQIDLGLFTRGVARRVSRWHIYVRTKKYQFWYIIEGLGMETFGIFYGHFVCLRPFRMFKAIWCVLWPFGILCVILVQL
jgi:hypothetical protein